MILPGRLFSDQRGAATVQYAVVAGILTTVVLAGSLALRGPLIDLYEGMANKANAALEAQPAASSSDAGEG